MGPEASLSHELAHRTARADSGLAWSRTIAAVGEARWPLIAEGSAVRTVDSHSEQSALVLIAASITPLTSSTPGCQRGMQARPRLNLAGNHPAGPPRTDVAA